MPLSPEAAGVALDVGADFLEVRRLAAFLREACTAAGVDEMTAFDCELALVEAANNVVEHGYAGREDGTMSLQVLVSDDHLRMVLTDSGRPAPEQCFCPRDMAPLDAVEGRGCGIIRSVISEIEYTSAGGVNRLTMIRRL